MSAHTPGPWAFSLEDGEVYSIPEYASVAMVLMSNQGVANARLIAAAPDLLAALKDAVELLDHHNYSLKEHTRAIAKAEGTS